VPNPHFSNNIGLCKRCKRKLASLGSYCEPCFFAIVEAMDSDEPDLDPVHEEDTPVIQLRNEEG